MQTEKMIFKWFILVYLITSCDCMPVKNNGTTPATPIPASSTTQSPKDDDTDQTLKMVELFSKIFGPLFGGSFITFILSYCYCRKIHPSAKKLMEIGNKDYGVPKGTCKNKCNCWPCWSCNVCRAYFDCFSKLCHGRRKPKNETDEKSEMLKPESEPESEPEFEPEPLRPIISDPPQSFDEDNFKSLLSKPCRISFNMYLKLYQKYCASWTQLSHRTYCSNSKCERNHHAKYSVACGLLMEPVMYYLTFDWTYLFDKLKDVEETNNWEMLFDENKFNDIKHIGKNNKYNIWCTLINFPNKASNAEEKKVLLLVMKFFHHFEIHSANIVCRDDKGDERKSIWNVTYGTSLEFKVVKGDLLTFPGGEHLKEKEIKDGFEIVDENLRHICDPRVHFNDESHEVSVETDYEEVLNGAKYCRINLNNDPKITGPYLQCLIQIKKISLTFEKKYRFTLDEIKNKTNKCVLLAQIDNGGVVKNVNIKDVKCVRIRKEKDKWKSIGHEKFQRSHIIIDIPKEFGCKFSVQVIATDDGENLLSNSVDINEFTEPEYEKISLRFLEKHDFTWDEIKNEEHATWDEIMNKTNKCVLWTDTTDINVEAVKIRKGNEEYQDVKFEKPNIIIDIPTEYKCEYSVEVIATNARGYLLKECKEDIKVFTQPDFQDISLTLEMTRGSTCILSTKKKIEHINHVEYRKEDDKNWNVLTDGKWEIKNVDETSYFIIENILKTDGHRYSIQVIAIDEEKKLIKGSCENIMAYTEYHCNCPYRREENVYLHGYNNGKQNNIEWLKGVLESWKCSQEITLETKIHPIPTNVTTSDQLSNGCPIAYKVSGFRELAKEYRKRNEHVRRFPPKYMIYNKTVSHVGNLFEDLLSEHKCAKVITGYDVTKHLRLFGYVSKDFEKIGLKEHKWENILVFHPEKRIIMLNFIVHDTKELTAALQHCNNSLNAIYKLNINHDIKNPRHNIHLVATLVLPNVTRRSLDDDYPFLKVYEKPSFFITKDELEHTDDESTSLKNWWDELKTPGESSEEIEPIFQNILAESLATVAMIRTHLPRMKGTDGKKVSTLLLNEGQLHAVYHEKQWRVITGPFGSGKSVILKAIAQNIYHQDSSSKIYYICFDPYSLLEIEISKYFEMIKADTDSQTEMISVNLEEMADKAGLKVEDIFVQSGKPLKNIADIIDYCIDNNDPGPVHFLIDEFPGDLVDENYCKRLRDTLNKKMQNSTLVIALQSVEKEHEILDHDESFKIQKSTLESAGMTVLPELGISMRMCSKPFELVEIAQAFVEDAKLPLPDILPVKTNTQKPSNKPLPLKSSNSSPLSDSTQIEDDDNDEYGKNDKYESRTKNLETTFTEPPHRTVVDTNELIDPHMLPKLVSDLESKQSSKALKTTFKFRSGKLGHEVKGEISRLVHLNNDFTKASASTKSSKILAIILKKLLTERYNCTIICNDMNEVIIIKYALEKIMKREYRDYTHYLQRQYPSKNDKKKILGVDEKQSSRKPSILVTDYRGSRGCESEHCITFVDPTTPYTNHVLVEILARAIVKVDLLILPATKESMEKESRSIYNLIKAWEAKPHLCEGMRVMVKEISQEESGKKLSITVQPKGEASGVRESQETTNVTIKDDLDFKEFKDKHVTGMSGDEAYRTIVQMYGNKNDDLDLVGNSSNPHQEVDCPYSEFGCAENITNIGLNEHLVAFINVHEELFRKSTKLNKDERSQCSKTLNELELQEFNEMQKLEENVKSLQDLSKERRNELETKMLNQTLEENINSLQEIQSKLKRNVEKCIVQLKWFNGNVDNYESLFKKLLDVMESDTRYMINGSLYYKVNIHERWHKGALGVHVVGGREFDDLKTIDDYTVHHNNNVCVSVSDDHDHVYIYLLVEEGWRHVYTHRCILNPKLHEKVDCFWGVDISKYRDCLVDGFILLQVCRK